MRLDLLAASQPVTMPGVSRVVISHDNGTPLAIVVELQGAVRVITPKEPEFAAALTAIGMTPPRIDVFQPRDPRELILR